MDSLMDDCSPYSRVSPFRDLRIKGYLLLPEAFRSLSRLSSALSAKASALRSFLLGLPVAIALAPGGLLLVFSRHFRDASFRLYLYVKRFLRCLFHVCSFQGTVSWTELLLSSFFRLIPSLLPVPVISEWR